jgi:hypothetical protein
MEKKWFVSVDIITLLYKKYISLNIILYIFMSLKKSKNGYRLIKNILGVDILYDADDSYLLVLKINGYITNLNHKIFLHPTLHFLQRFEQRNFDLSVLQNLYRFVLQNEIDTQFVSQIKNEYATVIFSMQKNKITLITGYSNE